MKKATEKKTGTQAPAENGRKLTLKETFERLNDEQKRIAREARAAVMEALLKTDDHRMSFIDNIAYSYVEGADSWLETQIYGITEKDGAILFSMDTFPGEDLVYAPSWSEQDLMPEHDHCLSVNWLSVLESVVHAADRIMAEDKEYIVVEEYLNGETGDVEDSTVLFSTYDENEARQYAEKHSINDRRTTQVAIWEMEGDSCRDSWIVKKNF